MEILRVENLSFTYPDENSPALKGVSLNVCEGDFVLLCGASGSGKSTFLRLLKEECAPFGKQEGKIEKRDSLNVGIVTQDAENQIVSDTVWHNMAFALENAGEPQSVIRQKIAETAEFFDLSHIFHEKTANLSGGEKQLLNLASVMVTDPTLLLLDEPTSQLDPIAAKRFTDMVKRLNSEMNTTIIISEHRTEELFKSADRVCVLENGSFIISAPPETAGEEAKRLSHSSLLSFPTSVRLYAALGKGGKSPISVRECRDFLEKNYNHGTDTVKETAREKGEKAIDIKNVFFRYEKKSPDVLRDFSLQAHFSEILTILGGNGSGKTTLLSLIAGTKKPYMGKIKIHAKKRVVLPQNVKAVFTKDVLEEDLKDVCGDYRKTAELLGIGKLLYKNPYDLSGGEAQRAAIAKALILKPDLLCLDEPTKGIDACGKAELVKILRNLRDTGVCVIIVTHDADFAAEVSDRCAMIFDGEVVSSAEPHKFFSENNFYTTYARRISRHMFKNAVTLDDCLLLLKENGEKR